jgi:hypothetical protein
MKRHLNRRQACEAVFCDVSQEEALQKLQYTSSSQCEAKPFACGTCKSMFTTRQALHRHRKQQHVGTVTASNDNDDLLSEVERLKRELQELREQVLGDTDLAL